MTRKEQIEQGSAINACYVGVFGVVGRITEDKLRTYQNGFIRGAEWSDENPKNLWISVDNDLPCNHREYVDLKYNSYTCQMLVRCKNGIYSVERMVMIFGRWRWAESNDITHWMPIPKLEEE